jgi:ABC-type Zn uptake system ZnuABC Zn-binding protein ZnuA
VLSKVPAACRGFGANWVQEIWSTIALKISYGDPELHEPTLADSRTVARARIVFMNDLNDEFEPWLEPLLKQAGFSGTKVVVSRGAKTLTGAEEHTISGKELGPAIDQHAWMDPKTASSM